MTLLIHDSLTPLLDDAALLRPHPDNARNGDVDAIVESMHRNGVYRPVFAQRSTGYILAGNHTYAALMSEDAKRIPVVWLDVTDEQAMRILLADNRTADLGNYDEGLLLRNLEGMAGDLSGTGYSLADYDDLLALMAAPDLDDLHDEHGDPTDDDTFVTVKMRLPLDLVGTWEAAADLTGLKDPVARDCALVRAAHQHLTG